MAWCSRSTEKPRKKGDLMRNRQKAIFLSADQLEAQATARITEAERRAKRVGTLSRTRRSYVPMLR